MSNVENLQDHMAYSCKCGCVDFNLLKSGGIECAYCGEKLSDSVWGLKQLEQKPVVWRWGVPKLKNGDFEWRYSLHQTRPDAIPLYTTPPKRKPLTDEELFKLWDEDVSCDMPDTFTQFKHTARAIEAAHGIKENT